MYVIWLLPKQDDEAYLTDKIEYLCQRYDAPKFVPHITVYGILDADLTILEESVNYAIQKISPFIVRKIDLRQSDNVWKSIYIEIESNQNLDSIYGRLKQRLSHYCDCQFAPHISLIYRKLDTLEKLKIISEIEIKNEFVIDKIAILEFSENVKEWKIPKSISL